MNQFIRILISLLGLVVLVNQANAKAPQAAKALETELVFTIEANIASPLIMGETTDGKRLSIPITGGRFYGDKLKGRVLPGGADYQVIRQDGVTELNAVYMMQTDDGALINVINRGLIVPESETQAFYFRTSPQFTAPKGQYDWLNKAIFVGGVRTNPDKQNTVLIDIYKLN